MKTKQALKSNEMDENKGSEDKQMEGNSKLPSFESALVVNYSNCLESLKTP